MRRPIRTGSVAVVLVMLGVGEGRAQVPAPPPLYTSFAQGACGPGKANPERTCIEILSRDAEEAHRNAQRVREYLDGFRTQFNAEQELRKQLDARVTALEKRTPPDAEKLTARIVALEGDVAALKSEVAGLKARATSNTIPQRVTAPFEVVDASGALLLHVGPVTTTTRPDGLHIDRSEGIPYVSIFRSGFPVAQMRGTAGGGGRLALARPGAGEGPRIFLDATESEVSVTDGRGMVLATMQAGTTEGPVVGVLAPDGNTLAGIGSNENGGRVFANFKDNSAAFKAGAQPANDADACAMSSKRGWQCIRVRLP